MGIAGPGLMGKSINQFKAMWISNNLPLPRCKSYLRLFFGIRNQGGNQFAAAMMSYENELKIDAKVGFCCRFHLERNSRGREKSV